MPVGEQGVFQGWIDFNGDGDFGVPGGATDANELLSTRDFTGGRVVLTNSVAQQRYCFDVPNDATTLDGNVHLRFRLTNDGLMPDNQAPRIVLVMADDDAPRRGGVSPGDDGGACTGGSGKQKKQYAHSAQKNCWPVLWHHTNGESCS